MTPPRTRFITQTHRWLPGREGVASSAASVHGAPPPAVIAEGLAAEEGEEARVGEAEAVVGCVSPPPPVVVAPVAPAVVLPPALSAAVYACRP